MYHGTYVESGDNLVQFILSFTFMWILGTRTWAAECAGACLSLTEPYYSNPMCFSKESDDPSLGACALPPFCFPKIQGHITLAI